ncbi:MAG: response regulator transcription factor [Parvibaculum sp.]|uniref:LuxR C-terminal-related transcriptional regulator n=1 Tax=Parvibaculum sp. TaxID=2024848 RepID=UPI003C715333
MLLEDAKIAIVDSNHLFRAGMAKLLNEVIGRIAHDAPDIGSLEEMIKNGERFDIVLLELIATETDPTPRIQKLRELLPSSRIVILTEFLNMGQLCACFAANVDGFLLENISCETLVESLKLILLDQKVFPSSMASLISSNGLHNATLHAADPPNNFAELSERELEILTCLVDGDSNKRIANKLHIAEATVKVHLKSVLRKTHMLNRTQAAIWALNKGMQGNNNTSP